VATIRYAITLGLYFVASLFREIFLGWVDRRIVLRWGTDGSSFAEATEDKSESGPYLWRSNVKAIGGQ